MTNDETMFEARMMNPNINPCVMAGSGFGHSDFIRHSSFVIRHLGRSSFVIRHFDSQPS
jgi:hypothetical protein